MFSVSSLLVALYEYCPAVSVVPFNLTDVTEGMYICGDPVVESRTVPVQAVADVLPSATALPAGALTSTWAPSDKFVPPANVLTAAYRS